MFYPIPLYGAFTEYTPAVPEFYQNIYSNQEGIKKILFELCKLRAYVNKIADAINSHELEYEELASRVSKLAAKLDLIEKALTSIALGGKSRSPIDGNYSPLYVIFKQMYDMLRIYGMTWKEVAETGKTWDEISATNKTYVEIELNASEILGDGEPHARYTSSNWLDVKVPGFKEF